MAAVVDLEALLASRVVRRGRVGPAGTQPDPPAWRLSEVSGRLVEVSGRGASAVLTAAVGLVLDAQRAGEPVAWISARPEEVYPPDLAASGVDLEALVVVRAARGGGGRGETHRRALRAAERLLRSGAFGLLVVDLGPKAALSLPVQTRLVGLAQRHDVALLLLTETPSEGASLGSLVTLRLEARRIPMGEGRFRCVLTALKDKRRGPGWRDSEVCRGPPGLR